MDVELNIITAIGVFLGGVGLFMLGVSMITDGLKLAAGNALRDILGRSTRTRWHGMFSGVFLTAMVQSSSAVTIATIGFVNAGLLGTAAALTIVLGATIGTTMTGWLVAAAGFEFSITSFALPMVGIGMFTRLVGPSRRVGAVGEAIAGFGLFFIGVDFLRGAFEGVAESMDIANLTFEGIPGALLFTGIGLVMTVLTQSSSAAIAIILTAATGGLVSFVAAAAAVIGATIGTTSTSALAVIDATASARRVAAGHVVINGFNALVGLALLPVLIWLVSVEEALTATPAVMLAIFHSTFNVAGVLLMGPFISRVARYLERRFRSPIEALGRPRYLDHTVMVSPTLALDAFSLELQRMAKMSRDHARVALSNDAVGYRHLRLQHDALRQLVLEVERYVTELESERLSKDVAFQLQLVLRIANYIDEAVTQAQECAEGDGHITFLQQSSMRDEVSHFQMAALRLIEHCDPQRENFDAAWLETEYQALRQNWRELKSKLLNAGVLKEMPVTRLNPAIDNLRLMLRASERCTKIAIRLSELINSVPEVKGKAPDASDHKEEAAST